LHAICAEFALIGRRRIIKTDGLRENKAKQKTNRETVDKGTKGGPEPVWNFQLANIEVSNKL
jgi:hypothetical protein